MGKCEEYWLEIVDKCSDCQYLSKLSGTFGHGKAGWETAWNQQRKKEISWEKN